MSATESSNKPGRFFVISAPSGSGKSTLTALVREKLPDLIYSVSYTTRAPRPGEVDGRDYNFVSRERFRAMIEAGDFLEWAEVFGRFYGTSRLWVEEKTRAGRDILADLEVKGAAAVRKSGLADAFIFIVPPTFAELRRRLENRRTESAEEIERRLREAASEIACRGLYDYLLINDDPNRAAEEMAGILTAAAGRRMAEMENFWPAFFADEPEPS